MILDSDEPRYLIGKIPGAEKQGEVDSSLRAQREHDERASGPAFQPKPIGCSRPEQASAGLLPNSPPNHIRVFVPLCLGPAGRVHLAAVC